MLEIVSMVRPHRECQLRTLHCRFSVVALDAIKKAYRVCQVSWIVT